ncbi:DUF1090 domain-containing protein [Microvirga sp. W0021]|uniref:DUF1090 domain-containing protein n=1 Tax=Hohaiivirga grylli TaxID=3133970 RepID=A0ABV0BIC4_9HYPH
MKKTILLSLAVLVGSTAVADARPLSQSCTIKEQKIMRELRYAREHRNQHRIWGLERALAEVRDRCTDEGLERKYRENIADKERKVEERKFDLREAEAEGDAKQIRKRMKKLREAEEELREARKELR